MGPNTQRVLLCSVIAIAVIIQLLLIAHVRVYVVYMQLPHNNMIMGVLFDGAILVSFFTQLVGGKGSIFYQKAMILTIYSTVSANGVVFMILT